MKKAFLTHIDLDAGGCLVTFFYFNQNKLYDEIHTINYDFWEKGKAIQYEHLGQYSELLFADITPDEKALKIILENNIKCTILDHHQSFYDDIWTPLSDEDKSKINYIFDNEKSGTLLSFEYYKGLTNTRRVPKALHDLVHYINAYDLWKEIDDEKNFLEGVDHNRLFWSSLSYRMIGYQKFDRWVTTMLNRIDIAKDGFFFTRREKEELTDILLKEKQIMRAALKIMLVRTDKLGRKFGITKMKSKISVVAWQILKGRTDLSYLIIINEYVKDDRKVSIRARVADDINLLELRFTKGHKKACGTKDITQEQIEDIWQGHIFDLVKGEEDE